MLIEIIIGISSLVFIWWLYARLTCGTCKIDKRLDGKTVIVTGANSGIGLETAKDLAKRGARVILACRSEQRGKVALEDVKKTSGSTNVALRLLDLSLMSSVRKFAAEIIAEEERLDILINNAGLFPDEMKATEEGLEFSYATNHFGPFLLTNLLLDKLKASSPSRIINVASDAHGPPWFFSSIDFEDLKGEKPFDSLKRYSETKLANVLFTHHLAKLLKGTGVSTFAIHPGMVKTSIGGGHGSTGITEIIKIIFRPVMKSSAEGAQTSIYCAVAPDIEKHSGGYFKDCALSKAAPSGRDDAVAKKLWDVSENITGLA